LLFCHSAICTCILVIVFLAYELYTYLNTGLMHWSFTNSRFNFSCLLLNIGHVRELLTTVQNVPCYRIQQLKYVILPPAMCGTAVPQFMLLVASFPPQWPGQVMWVLWWTKWRWGRFSPSTSASPANSHSTDLSTLIIYGPGLVQ
jgi:hypothetical protein